jgi:hypothetical protein
MASDQANNEALNIQDFKTQLPGSFMTILRQANQHNTPVFPSKHTQKGSVNVAQPTQIQIHNHIPNSSGTGGGTAYGESHLIQGAGGFYPPPIHQASPPPPSAAVQAADTPRKAALNIRGVRYTKISHFLLDLETNNLGRQYLCYQTGFTDCLGAETIGDLLRTIRETAANGDATALGPALLKLLREEKKEFGVDFQIPPIAVATSICQELEVAALACEDAPSDMDFGLEF